MRVAFLGIARGVLLPSETLRQFGLRVVADRDQDAQGAHAQIDERELDLLAHAARVAGHVALGQPNRRRALRRDDHLRDLRIIAGKQHALGAHRLGDVEGHHVDHGGQHAIEREAAVGHDVGPHVVGEDSAAVRAERRSGCHPDRASALAHERGELRELRRLRVVFVVTCMMRFVDDHERASPRTSSEGARLGDQAELAVVRHEERLAAQTLGVGHDRHLHELDEQVAGARARRCPCERVARRRAIGANPQVFVRVVDADLAVDGRALEHARAGDGIFDVHHRCQHDDPIEDPERQRFARSGDEDRRLARTSREREHAPAVGAHLGAQQIVHGLILRRAQLYRLDSHICLSRFGGFCMSARFAACVRLSTRSGSSTTRQTLPRRLATRVAIRRSRRSLACARARCFNTFVSTRAPIRGSVRF